MTKRRSSRRITERVCHGDLLGHFIGHMPFRHPRFEDKKSGCLNQLRKMTKPLRVHKMKVIPTTCSFLVVIIIVAIVNSLFSMSMYSLFYLFKFNIIFWSLVRASLYTSWPCNSIIQIRLI